MGGRGGSPYKENNNSSPRALLFFYYGDKTQGTQSIEGEMKKGLLNSEEVPSMTTSLLMQGTPTVPFGDYMNGGTTPLRDRADTQQLPSASKFSVSNNNPRNMSAEKKVNGAFN